MWNTRRDKPDPNQDPITGDMTLAEALAAVPEAGRIFQEHGVHPEAYCGPTVQILRLDETPAHCRLEDLEGLLAKLNAAARRPNEHPPLTSRRASAGTNAAE